MGYIWDPYLRQMQGRDAAGALEIPGTTARRLDSKTAWSRLCNQIAGLAASYCCKHCTRWRLQSRIKPLQLSSLNSPETSLRRTEDVGVHYAAYLRPGPSLPNPHRECVAGMCDVSLFVLSTTRSEARIYHTSSLRIGLGYYLKIAISPVNTFSNEPGRTIEPNASL